MPDPGIAERMAESGGFAVQPDAEAPPSTRNEIKMMIAPGRTVQNESMLRKGKAMSRAPIWSGMRKFPNPETGASERTKNTMIVPCMVKSIT